MERVWKLESKAGRIKADKEKEKEKEKPSRPTVEADRGSLDAH